MLSIVKKQKTAKLQSVWKSEQRKPQQVKRHWSKGRKIKNSLILQQRLVWQLNICVKRSFVAPKSKNCKQTLRVERTKWILDWVAAKARSPSHKKPTYKGHSHALKSKCSKQIKNHLKW